MTRRTENAAQAAADAANKAASDAGRVLQQRGQEVKEPKSENREGPPVIRVKARNEPRRLAFEEMERINDERHGLKPAEEKEEPKEEPKVEKKDPPEPQAEVVAQPEPVTPQAESPKTVKVKIDGEESEVLQTEIDEYGGEKAYRISKAAEKRLKDAAEERAEAKKLTATLIDLIQKQQPQKPAEVQVSDDEFIKAKLDEIRFGSPEEATKVFKEVVSRIAKPIDTEAVIAKATQKFEHDMAVKAFDREFKDITSDPDLLQLAFVMRHQELQKLNNQVLDWNGFYTTIGSRIRTKFGRSSQTPASPNPTTSTPSASEKEARKASITNLPTAAARATQPEPEKEQTREEILAEARSKRRL